MINLNPTALFVLVPAAAAIACALLGKKRPRLADAIANLTFLGGISAAVYYIRLHAANNFIAPKYGRLFYMIDFFGDNFSLLMLFTIYLVSFCVAFYCVWRYRERERRGTFFALLTLCAAAMCGVVTARDFFTLYVFVEAVAVTSYALIAFEGDAGGCEGAVKYFLLSAPASMFIVFGISILVLCAGGTSFGALTGQITPYLSADVISGGGRIPLATLASTQMLNPAVTLALGLMLCGFLVKSGVVPFHGWVPDAYQGANAPVSALLAGIVTKAAGVYAVIRIMMIIREIAPGGNPLGQALMIFGALSILVGAFGAVFQREIKRMLAYSSISQVGYIVLAAGLGTPLALAGAIFHLFNHATFKTSLFLNSAALEESAGTTDMRKLGGLEARMPWTAWTSIVAMLSTAGIPPLSGFWSKLIIILALWQAGAHGYAVLAILASALTLAYFLILQRKVFFGKTPAQFAKTKEVCFATLTPVIILSAIMIAVGLYFPVIWSFLVDA